MRDNSFPRITLVTPSFNQAQFLAETIESVLAQGYPNLEYFVLDGGSTDGSLEILQSYSDRLTYWESVRDNGQADAIAKGFARSTGDLLNWLNSDDRLAPNALNIVAEMYRSDPAAGIYAAVVENFIDGQFGERHEISAPQNLDIESMFFRSGRRICRHQPGVYFSQQLMRKAGSMSTQFHICMDVDLHSRMLAAGGRVIYDSRTVAFFRRHPAAKTAGVGPNSLRFVEEYIEISNKIGGTLGLRPRHWRGHWRTLLATLRYALIMRDRKLLLRTIGVLWRVLVGCV